MRRTAPNLVAVSCASPLAAQVHLALEAAVAAGWEVWPVATPSGADFLDVERVESITGRRVTTRFRLPGDPPDLPVADAVLAAPATVNTVDKWSAGICDNLALGVLVEALGLGCPITAVPYSNRAHAAHPAFAASLRNLREWGVNVLFGDWFWPLAAPRSGQPVDFPWERVCRAVDDMRPDAT